MTDTRAHFDDEARLTAYVLGELDESDAAALEAQIGDDASLRREVEEIRQATAMLQAELKAEPAPGLTDAQRSAVTSEQPSASHDRSPVLFSFRRLWAGVGLAAAACLLVTAALFWTDRQVAQDEVAIEIESLIESLEGAETRIQTHVGQLEKARSDRLASSGTRGETAPSDQALEHRRRAPGPGGASAGAPARERQDPARSLGRARQERPSTPSVGQNDALHERLMEPRRAALPPPPPEMEPALPQGFGGGGGAGGGLRAGADVDEAGAGADRSIRAEEDWNREAYDRLVDNPFIRPHGESALSTFSIDVDTASYSNIRRYIDHGRMPPRDAVRIEELINYFNYGYEPPTGEDPFSVNVEVNACPWAPQHRLVRIGLQGREIPRDMRPATNLVFLIDVSGSMNDRNKLPLLKESMKMLVENLLPDDKVAMVVYAGASGVVLPSTYCDDRQVIIDALDRLEAGGSTHGSAGIQLAYEVAQENFISGGANRVILCTDGDFNVGISDDGSLVRLIEEKRESGVFLSVLGFGSGNWQDAKMEKLSNAGNGNFAYIDGLDEAKKVLVEQMSGTLVTIARDVKIQVEFNPAQVSAYRLIGYANRLLAPEDFNDDTKDAGEIGAGHTVTALYEIVPPGVEIDLPQIDALEFQQPAEVAEAETGGHALLVKLRYKEPDGGESRLLKRYVSDEGAALADASGDFQFAAAVAGFGMLLRDSEHKGDATYERVLDLAAAGRGADEHGYRSAFIDLVEKAKMITGQTDR